MQTHLYRDAFYCHACAAVILEGITTDRRRPRIVKAEPMDCPMHCERCGLFLETPLTEVGREFVKSWCAVPPELIEPDALRLAVAAWRAFYVLS